MESVSWHDAGRGGRRWACKLKPSQWLTAQKCTSKFTITQATTHSKTDGTNTCRCRFTLRGFCFGFPQQLLLMWAWKSQMTDCVQCWAVPINSIWHCHNCCLTELQKQTQQELKHQGRELYTVKKKEDAVKCCQEGKWGLKEDFNLGVTPEDPSCPSYFLILLISLQPAITPLLFVKHHALQGQVHLRNKMIYCITRSCWSGFQCLEIADGTRVAARWGNSVCWETETKWCDEKRGAAGDQAKH